MMQVEANPFIESAVEAAGEHVKLHGGPAPATAFHWAHCPIEYFLGRSQQPVFVLGHIGLLVEAIEPSQSMRPADLS